MSVLKRVLSGSAAAWVKILVTVITQIALVPVFLTHWSVEQYGCWLIIQAVSGFSTTFSLGHQEYIGYEFLKFGKNTQSLSEIFYSAIPFAILISLIELSIVLIIIILGLGDHLFDPKHTLNNELVREALFALVIYSVAWLISTSVSGLAGRLLTTYGYFSRVAWWGVLMSILSALLSIILVTSGAGLLVTVASLSMLYFFVSIPIHLDLWFLCKQYKLYPQKPNWTLGLRNALKSTAVSLTVLLDFVRQQGIRVFLGTSVGVSEMTAFSTMRTLSNVSLQGIGTVTGPVAPELIAFLREKNQVKTDATFGFIWLLTVIMLAPVLVIIQWLIPEVFSIWTRGKVIYDPIVFGFFSMSLLVFALSRVPLMVLQGNNILRKQINITLIVGTITALGILLIAPKFGIRGAAFMLLIAEIIGCIYSLVYSVIWMKEYGLYWPWRLLNLCLGTIGITSLGISLYAMFPSAKLVVLSCTFILNCIIGAFFINELPKFVIFRILKIFRTRSSL
jgi:O-antigen/teichoic acid export membrane protein